MGSRHVVALMLASVLAPQARADVLVVDPFGGGPFVSIPAALELAQNGDTILFKTGQSGPFVIDGIGIEIIADGPLGGFVNGNIVVKNISPGQSVLLSGLTAMGDPNASLPGGDEAAGPALFITAAQGSVRVVDCILTGAASLATFDQSGTVIGTPDGFAGAQVRTSADVSFLNCTLTGGSGGLLYEVQAAPSSTVFTGGAGLFVENSEVSVYDSSLTGGFGGINFIVGPDGGAGLDVLSSTVFASGNAFVGGNGGNADDLFAQGIGGDGGPGAASTFNSTTRFLECSFAGGGPGFSAGGTPAHAGPPRDLDGQNVDLPGLAHRLVVSPVVREFQPLSFSAQGHTGDPVFVFISRDDGSQYFGEFTGQLHVSIPWQNFFFLGTVPPGGELNGSTNLPAISSGFEGLSFRLQALFGHSPSTGVLSNWAPLMFVDDAF